MSRPYKLNNFIEFPVDCLDLKTFLASEMHVDSEEEQEEEDEEKKEKKKKPPTEPNWPATKIESLGSTNRRTLETST